jgi:hypothetical protein
MRQELYAEQMPRTGTQVEVLMSGAPASCTLDAAERIRPFGRKSLSEPRIERNISQYTFASRTLRAMSWVYWDPKSRINIRSLWMSDKRNPFQSREVMAYYPM